jgi:hypothetical protein
MFNFRYLEVILRHKLVLEFSPWKFDSQRSNEFKCLLLNSFDYWESNFQGWNDGLDSDCDIQHDFDFCFVWNQSWFKIIFKYSVTTECSTVIFGGRGGGTFPLLEIGVRFVRLSHLLLYWFQSRESFGFDSKLIGWFQSIKNFFLLLLI